MVMAGPAQLKDWMIRRKFLQVEAAEYLGYDAPYISQLLSGSRTPGLDNALKIERMTGIPVEAWASSDLGTLVGTTPRERHKAR